MASLKGESRYTRSVEHTRDHIPSMEKQIEELLVECESRELQLQRERKQNHDQRDEIQRLQYKIETLEVGSPKSGREKNSNDMVCAHNYIVAAIACPIACLMHTPRADPGVVQAVLCGEEFDINCPEY